LYETLLTVEFYVFKLYYCTFSCVADNINYFQPLHSKQICLCKGALKEMHANAITVQVC